MGVLSQRIAAKRRGLEEMPPDMVMAFTHWEKARDGRWAPRFRDFELIGLPSNLLPTTLVADYHRETDRFVFRFFGTQVTSVHGVDLTGRSPTDAPSPDLGLFVEEEFRRVLVEKKPEFLTYSFERPGGAVDLQTVLRLPLSEDGVEVSAIVSIIRFSEGYEETMRFLESVGSAASDMP